MLRRDLSVCVVVAAVGVILSLGVTRHHIAFDTDSGVYLATAQNVLDGRGVTTPFQAFTSELGPREAASLDGALPLTHYPPLYPVAVASVAATGIDIELAARVLGAALLGLNLLLIGLLARRVLPGVLTTACLILLALVGPVSGLDLGPHHSWLFVHGLAMSEPLFIALSLAALLVLDRHIATGDGRLLVAASTLAGLATATRFVGVALIITGAVMLLPHVRRAAAFLAVGVMPVVGWTLLSRVLFGGGAPRSVHLSNPRLFGIFSVFEGWLGLTNLPSIMRHVFLVGVLALVGAIVTRTPTPLLRLLCAYALAFTGTVVLTRAILDLSTPFNDRVFAPLQGPFYVLLVGALATVRAPAMRGLVPACAATLIAIGLPAAMPLVAHGNPRSSPPEEVFAAAGDLPAGALIATNIPTRLWDLNRRPSINVPMRIIAVSLKTNDHFDEQVHELTDVIVERHGYIVLLGPEKAGFVSPLFPSEEELLRLGSLRVVRRTTDGVILGAR